MSFLSAVTACWLWLNVFILALVTLCYFAFPQAAISSGNPFSKNPDPLSRFDRYSVNSTECGSWAVFCFVVFTHLRNRKHKFPLLALCIYSGSNVAFGADSYLRVGLDDDRDLASSEVAAMAANVGYLAVNAGLLFLNRKMRDAEGGNGEKRS